MTLFQKNVFQSNQLITTAGALVYQTNSVLFDSFQYPLKLKTQHTDAALCALKSLLGDSLQTRRQT